MTDPEALTGEPFHRNTGFDVHPAAHAYYPCDIELAMQCTRERIEEWEYPPDKHGYCHDRPPLIALLGEIDRLRAELADQRASRFAWSAEADRLEHDNEQLRDEVHTLTCWKEDMLHELASSPHDRPMAKAAREAKRQRDEARAERDRLRARIDAALAVIDIRPRFSWRLLMHDIRHALTEDADPTA